MTRPVSARFGLGQIVRHRSAGFRGVVIDVDPVFAGRPGDTGPISPDQPFYQVLALGSDGGFMAYAPEDSLEHDPELSTLTEDAGQRFFTIDASGHHAPLSQAIH
ncbi:heat shock protein HspQ [Brevundimonas sp.]|jgi:heat shock protein HspQ|uniref:heat shock protein HspQ n=1 Tax=Brevundimonas sp. TaxID=1871086 RepID=UPI003F71A372